MKRFLPFLLLFIFLFPDASEKKLSQKDLYRIAVNEHQFSQRAHLSRKELKAIPKRDRPDLAWEQDYLATMDPALGHPTPERLVSVYQQVAQQRQAPVAPGSASTPWTERGPSNVSGRTRAIAFDPNDPTGKKVWAGGVTGGLWYNTDITSASTTWVAVDDFWDNIAITAIAFDPANSNILYVGTGEGWGAGAGRGAGIWKSTNGGTTWSHLSSTSSFYYVNDLVVRNESGSGVLYVAIRGNYYGQSWHGSADQGLQRSTDGGLSFTQVLPNIPGESQNFVAADIELGPNNKIWVGTTTSSYSLTDQGGGRILSSSNGTTWTTNYTSANGERVELACAPSDANYVYAAIEAGNVVDAMVRTTNGGTTWSSISEPDDDDPGISSTDFSRGQAWYDLILAVDPNNRNTVLTGAIDLFKTTNGGTSWSQLSHWYGGFGYPNVHADQHTIVYKPGSSSQVLFGNDGGVYRSANINNSSPGFSHRNNGYNVTQFYACAIHPGSGSDYFLAGAQDNGSQQFNGSGINSTTEVTGGDGAFCFIDQTNANYQITSYVYNSYWLSTDGGFSFGNSRIQDDQTTGRFINPADYDDQQDVLYSARTSSTINRIINISGSPVIGSFSVTGMSTMASHLRVSPYTTSSTTLFVGTGAGDLYKITNANGTSPSSTSIGGSLPAGYISCVEIGASENELLVTFTNYGLTSVWYTANGGSTWQSKEGNLPDMPVRWALFNPNDRNEVILATEVGVWSTTNFNSSSPNWASSNSGLANVRVDMLQIRQSDYEVIASTHGRGLFSSNGFAAAQVPVANFGFSKKYPCTGESVFLGDSSSASPNIWQWTITPNTFSYTRGTNGSSQYPEVIFNSPGWYSLKLKVINANGNDSLELSQAIRAGGHELPFIETFETASVSEWTVQNPDASYTWSLFTIGGTSPGTHAAGVENFSYNAAGQRDGLLSPAIDLSSYTQATLSFSYAYRRYDATYQDSLAVFISTDCGSTWSRIASYKENGTGNFATGSDLGSSFTPSSTANWCGAPGNPICPSIDISSYAGNANVRLKFENICGYGNNMYVDNINLTGVISAAPLANFSASATSVCQGDTVNFSDLSTNSPTSWNWSFSPSTVTYTNSTSASSQHPAVIFSSPGTYQVSLTASNSTGSDAEVKAGYITVNASLTPSVAITASQTNICGGTSVNFTATPTNGGNSPFYQWKVNGVNAGTNSSSFSSSTLAHNDVVTMELTSSESCVTGSTATSNSISMNVSSPVTPAVSISASASSICGGSNVIFTATSTLGGLSPTYQWKVNGVNAGTNSATFSSNTLANNDVVLVELASSESCVTSSTATSNAIAMSVTNPLSPQVSIAASTSTICMGDMVQFTATPTAGGSSPTYQWKINGVNAGTNSASFSSSTLANNDVVSVELTSSESCVTSSTGVSNSILMIVNSAVMPTASISASDTMICEGQSVFFSASIANGGSAPTYQWKVNGSNAGSGFATFSSSNLNDSDVVTLELLSSLGCASPAQVTSNSILMRIIKNPQISISTPLPIAPLCAGDTLLLSATANSFGQQGIGNWTGPGVQGSKFIASIAGTGTHTLYYSYILLNAPFCSGADTMVVEVENVPKPGITQSGMQLICNQSGYTYQWIKDGSPVPGAIAQSYTVTGNGLYSVKIGLTHCSEQSGPLAINDFGMNELIAATGFKLYPNPARKTATFEMLNPGVGSLSYELISFSGAVVLRNEITAEGIIHQSFDMANLAAGVYTLRIKAGEIEIRKKLIKM